VTRQPSAGRELILDCLQALARQTRPLDEIVVVDNGSSDGSPALLRDLRDVLLVRSAGNLGFAAAFNIGVRAASGEWIASVNVDSRPEPDWLEILLVASERVPPASRLGALIIGPGAATIDAAGHRLSVFGHGIKALSGERVSRLQEGAVHRVWGLPANGALFPRAGLWLREDLFMLYEDVELDWREAECGNSSWLVPAARVRHDVGNIRRAFPARSRYLALRNQRLVAHRTALAWLREVWSWTLCCWRGEGRVWWRARRDAHGIVRERARRDAMLRHDAHAWGGRGTAGTRPRGAERAPPGGIDR
jgi:GT2 family glycosyltransferase